MSYRKGALTNKTLAWGHLRTPKLGRACIILLLGPSPPEAGTLPFNVWADTADTPSKKSKHQNLDLLKGPLNKKQVSLKELSY